MRRGLVLFAVAFAFATAAGSARADGDPASDYLLTQQLFLPSDAKVPATQARRLSATVAAANRAGYRIRVALISSSYDLGAVTSLWRRPRTYARFLAAELEFVYKGRLLVVMPNGFGFADRRHSPAPEYARLAAVPIGPGSAGLAAAAETAVRRLATAAGARVVTNTTPAPAARNSNDRTVIAVAALGAILVAWTARFLLRRRRR
jgi:hypothetical protein